MTVDEFEEQRGQVPCLYFDCGSMLLDTRPYNQHIELYCKACNRHQKYLKQSKQPNKRPKLARGTLDEVWEGASGHCAHCGLDESILKTLGLHRTVQHVPPFTTNGHEGYLIPLCSWCQQHSASEMKRLTSLIERLAKKFNMNA